MKKYLSLLLLSCLSIAKLSAQVTGTKVIGTDYATLAAAIADLNTNGISGNVIINVPAGYTETAPTGGYLLGSATLNASTSATSTLTIQKSGATANPLLTAPVGTSASVDGIFFIQGTDYVTIDGIDLTESAANTTANPQMEFGYALVKRQAVAPFDGCQNVTIKNCTITLTILYPASTGIYANNHTATSASLLTITAPTDAMNNCVFSSNTIQNCNTGMRLIGYAGAASPYTLYDQNNTIGGGSTAGNTIQNYGANAVILQYQNNEAFTYNTINNISGGGTVGTGGGVGVNVGPAINASVNVSNNTINLSIGSTTGNTYGIYINSSGTGTINLDANTLTASGGGTGGFYMIFFASGNTNMNVTNNNFSNINVATTGALALIMHNLSASTFNMYCNGNYTSGPTAPYVTKTGSGGTFYGYNNSNSSTAGTTTISNNNFSNITLTGATTFIGIYESNANAVNAGMTKYVFNNVVSNISTAGVSAAANYGIAVGGAPTSSISNCRVSNMNVGIGNGYAIYHWNCTTDTIRNCRVNGLTSTGGNVYGITTTNTSTTTRFYNDTLNGLSTSFSTGAAYGIYQSGATTAEIYKNALYDISATGSGGSAYGLYLISNSNIVSNNFVADIRTPNYTTATVNAGTQLVGIYCGAGTNYNLYHNTIYLNGTSTGANFGSSAVYAQTGNATFNNNIFINNSTPAGTGMVAAYRRSAIGLTGYQAASNNNLFYAGTPAANSVIMYDGTVAYQTLATYKTLVTPRDAASVTENVTFQSVTGGTPGFLKPSTTVATQVESNGINIPGITDDIFGTVRAGNTGYAGVGVTPDLGAVEADYIPLDLSAPGITYTSLTSTCATGNRTVTATITDVTGVPVSGTLVPHIYYKKGAGTWYPSAGVLTSGTATNGTWTFTITASDMGGVVGGDVISYFVVAQDGASTPNIGSNPVGVAATDVNTIGTYPATLNTYSINYTLGIPSSYDVGAGGYFTTITAAANAYNTACLTGPVVFSLISATYPSEIFPITLTGNAAASATNTLTIRPATGMTPTITGSGAPTFSLDGAQYVTIDGRAGGTGTTKALTISNTTTNAANIRFINSASYDTIKYCSLVNVNTATNTGTIFFSSSTGATGNSNNLIDNCDFVGGATPYIHGIYSNGTAGKENINNTVSNCNFADFFSATIPSNGIYVTTGSSAWTITGNRFYQTGTRTYTTGGNTHRAIYINVSAGTGFVVTNNIIGYASSSGTLTYTMTSPGTTITFKGIELSVGTATPSSVQGNTITGISLSGLASAIIGIHVVGGSVDVGTTTGNTIGSPTTTGAITVVNTGTANPAITGINTASSAGAVNIQNNKIGSLTATGTATTGMGIFGIQASGAATVNISADTIGSIATANSINSNFITTTAAAIQVYGINSSLSSASTISNNTIANLNLANSANLGFASGIIHTGTGALTISGNTVRNISSATSATQLSGQTGVNGIAVTGTGTATISQNTINAISATNVSTVQANVAGIGLTSATNSSILGNRIYDIRNASTFTVTTTPPTAIGILIGNPAGTNTTIANNMISLGNGQTTNTEFMGIMNSTTSACSLKVYYNSINIEGAASIGALPTMGFNRGNNTTTAITTPIEFKNNIVRNVRTGGTGKHYAIVNGILVITGSAAGWPAGVSNNNILNAAAATVGFWSADQTLAAWRTTSFCDANSYSGAALTFTNTVTGDLHISMGTTGNYIESHGTPVTVTNDYDNETRPGPAGSVNGGGVITDIGADEFDGVSIDDVAPAITYTILPTTCSTGDRTLTATIADQSGVPATGSTAPRIYYKKGLAGTWYSRTGTLSSGTVTNGTWSFPIVSADMGSVSGADRIYYYVVAQDVAGTPNIGASPGAGFAATSVAVITTPPTTPNNYFVSYASGIFNVGVGQPFTTITEAVNSYNTNTCLTGPVTFVLTDATYSAGETFPITINNNSLASSTVTLTIKPAPGVAATVTDLATSASVFKLLNAQYVTIDGLNAGGSSLTLNNSNIATSAVVWLASTVTTGPGNKNISLLNMNMNGGLNTLASNWGIIAGVDGAGPTATNGMDNDSVTVQGNYIKKCGYSLYLMGTAATAAGGLNGWVIKNNILGPSTYSATENLCVNGTFMRNMTNVVFSGNTLQNIGHSSVTGAVVGMYFETGIDGMVIDSNIVDTVIANTSSTFQVCAFYVNTGNRNFTISRNKITAMYNTNTGGFGARGIVITNGTAASNCNIVNNFISDVVNYSSTSAANMAAGISVDGTSGGVNVWNNSINLFGSHLGLTTATGSADILITTTGTGIDIRNNVLVNSYENSSSTIDKAYAIYSSAASTVYSNVDYNDYYCNGGTPVLGYVGGVDRPTLADMITGFGGNTHSINNSVPFVGPMDMHVPAGTASPLESAGIAISGVTNDIDGQVRPGPAGSTNGGGINPDMGADEFDGIPTDATAPLVSYTALSTPTCAAGDRTLSGVTITDASGVPTTGSLVPRIYFKKTAGPWYSAPGTQTSGTATSGVWSFTISATTMGGLIATDVVSYYVAAQDVATTPNVGAYPSIGFAATGVNTVTAAPTTASAYTVVATLGGSYTVGTTGVYPTLTSAINAYNTACLTGPVTFLLTDATYSTGETFPLVIRNNTDASSINTLTIKPAGVTATITGTAAAAAVIKLLNARYVTIDGLNSGGSSLTVNNSNTGSSAVVWLASTLTTGPGNRNISLLNMNMNGGIATSSTNYGIVACVDGATPGATNGMDNDTITIQGNYIKKCGYAIWAAGTTATAAGGLNGWVMRNNILGPWVSNATDNLGVNGMFLRNMTNVLYAGNTMQNVQTLVGMYIEAGVDGIVIDSNIVDSVFTTTAPSIAVCAYFLGTGVKNATISRNKISSIYALNATGYGARGITVTNATAASNVTIVNNFISDLISYSSTTVANWVAGIGVDGTSGGVNIWNNSINLFGSHVGLASATGSADITISTTGTGIDVRNNILVNTYENSSSSLDKTYAIYSTAASTAYTNIDYNDYYCTGGTPVLGFVGGVDRPVLADMITGFGGNTHSLNQSVAFTSAMDLHLPVGAITPLESAGTLATGGTTDIDGDVRPGPVGSIYGAGTAPDIGADEFDGSNIDNIPPLISITPMVATTCGTGDRTLAGVTISDQTGVSTAGTLVPRIYFKKNAGSWYSAPGTQTGGTALNGTWSFTISATAMGGLAASDVVSYYVVAQDIMTPTPNVGAYPGASFSGTDVNTIGTPPSVPLTYTIIPTLGGVYTVGTSGAYPTLTSAVNAYNTACLSGAVTFQLTDATYPSETYPITVLGNPAASSANTLTIQPAAGVAVNITGSTSAVAVFKFLNAKYVTIDGLNTGGSSMAVTNNNTTTSGNTCDFWLAAGSAAGSGNNFIALKNMNITGGAGNSTTNQGIVAGIDGGSPTNTAGMDNDNITISGNTMRRMGYLVRALGTAVTSAGGLDNWTISNNIMGPAAYSATDNIGYNGMYLQNLLNLSVTGNTMQNIGYTSGAGYTIAGIYMPSNINGLVISGNTFSNMMSTGTGTGTGANMALYLGTGVINATITGNNIHTIYNNNTSGYGARGIILNTGSATSNIVVANNFISDIYGYSSTGNGNWPAGVSIEGATGGVSMYYNSISLNSGHTGLNNASGSACLLVTSTGGSLDIRDNLLSNTYDNTSSATDKGWSIYSTGASSAFSNIDYNDYYAGTPNVRGYIGGDRVALSDIVAGFGGNTYSISTQPIFVSPTDLHLQAHAGNLPLVAGTTIASVTTDIDGTTRGTPPVIGADEVSIPNCSGTPTAGIVNATPAAGCGTFNSALSLTGSTFLPGITYQWETSTDDVTYTPVSGATSTSYAATVSSTIYYRATITCTIGGLSASTTGLPLIYTPFPAAIAGPSTLCTGNTISLTSATGGGTWSSGAPAIATVSSSGVVTGVTAGAANISYTASGCSVSSSIAVTQAPTTPVVSNTIPVFCSGSSSILSAVSTNSVTTTSGTISVLIPDNSALGASTAISVAGIPAGAVITSASVNFNVTMSITSDINLNLTAPNGNTINLVHTRGGGANFTNTKVSSTSATSFSSASNPYNGTFAADFSTVANAGSTTYPVNSTTWASLYSVPNGTWVLSGRDILGAITGTITSWSLSITYSMPSSSFVWSPTADLYTDAGLTVPYTGTGVATVYAAPTAPTTPTVTTYSVVAGCSSQGTTTVTANPLPANIAGSNTVCVGSSTTLTNDTTGGTWSSSALGTATVASATGVVNGVVAGVATMTYTKSATGCFKTMQMTVNPLPAAIAGTASVCETATTTLTDAGGGTWSSDGTSIAIVGSATGVVTGVSAGFAQITYTLPTTCKVSQQVTVNPTPIMSVTPTPVPDICFGATTSLAANATMNNFALMSQDFNVGLGAWTITNIDGNAASYWQLTASPGYSGTTGDGSQMIQAAPDAYMGITHARFTSPSFSTVGYDAVTLSFNEYLLSLSSSDDTVAVEYSTDGGTVWNTVLDQVDNIIGSGSWVSSSPEVSVALPAGAVGQPSVKLRWNYYSNQGLWWAVDNIKVSAAHPAPSFTWSGVAGATGLSCTACTSVDVTPASSGANEYSVVATTSAGCVNSVSAIVSVNPLPSTIGGTLVVCQGDITSATDVDAGGTWSIAATSIATVDVTTGAITGVSAGTAEITYTLPTGCTTTAVVTVNPLPAPITGIMQVCEGLTTTLGDITAGGNWSSSSTHASVDAAGVVTGITAGVETITFQLPTSCIITADVTVNPTPAAITGMMQVCEGLTTTLSSTSTGGTWISSATGTASIDITTGVVTGVMAGVSTITYQLPEGCTTIADVTVNPLPAPITGVMQVCEGLTTTLGDITTGGNWSSSSTHASVDAAGVVTGITAGVETITYQLPTTCISTADVTVNPTPAAITGMMQVCEGLTTTLSSTSAGGTWASSATGTASIDVSTGIVTGVMAGVSTITYQLPEGCTTIAEVTVNPLPAPITGVMQVCEGLTTTLGDITTGGNWSSSSTHASVDAAGVVSGITAGVETITFQLPTSCLITADVTVNPTPAAITGMMQVCEGLTTTLSSTSVGGTWASSATGTASIDLTTGVVTGMMAGVATITYQLPEGCTTTADVTVNPLPAPITGVMQVCEGLTTTLGDITTGGAWSSSSTHASVDAAGVVTGITTGLETITFQLPTSCIITADVTVNPTPAAITGMMQVCEGLTTTLSSTSAGGTWASGATGTASVGATTGVVTGMMAGVATITYQLPEGCTSTADVTVNPLPAPITGVMQVCEGLITTLGDITTGGTWSSSSTRASVDATGVVTGITAGVETITYQLPTSCLIKADVTVNPTPAAITGTMQVCEGLTTTLGNTSTGGTWASGATGTASVGATTGVVTGVMAGITTITYKLPEGCTSTANVTVNPVPAAITGVMQVCEGLTTTLSSTTGGGTWSGGTAGIATIGASGVVSGISAGSASVTYTLATGCLASAGVTVNPLPAAIGGTAITCIGVTTTLNNAVTGGTWSSGAAGIATVGSATGIVTGVSAGNAQITYTLSTGCYKSANVTVNGAPAVITGTMRLCAGSATALSDSDPGGTWVSGAPAIASVAASGVVSGISVGTATISYMLSAGCVATTVVTIDPLPAPIAGPSQLCVGATGAFTNGTSGGTWTSNTPLVATIDITTGAATAIGAGTTILNYTSTAGCVRTRVLTVNALPASIVGPSELCKSSTITLADATAGGTWSSSTVAVATINGAGVLSGVTDGVTAITYTLFTGCTAMRIITVNPLPSVISGAANVCQGQTITLFNAATGGTWISNANATAPVNPATGVVTGVAVGSAIISYTLPSGCSRSVAVLVSATPAPITGATSVCQGTTTTMTTSSTGGVWTSSITSVASIGLTTGVVTGLAVGTTSLSYTMPGGCSVTYTTTVDAIPAAFTGTLAVCYGQSATLSSSTTGGTWSSSNAAVASIGAAGIVSGVSAGTAVISYVAPSGCVRTAVMTVNALPAVHNVTGGGNYCAGGSGVHIGLDNSDGGVLYQLYSGTGALGSPVAGVTGVAADFGVVALTGTYSVVAASPATGCSNNMSGSATVTVAAVTPASVSLASSTGSYTVCSGAPVTFTASPINGGTSPAYQWRVNGSAITGATSNTYSYAPVTGDVVSLNMSSSIVCATPSVATASATIMVNPAVMPAVSMVVAPGASVCLGNSATFSATALNGGTSPVFIWMKNSGVAAVGPTYTYTPANGDNVYVKLAGNNACALADTVLSSAVTMTVSPIYTPMVNVAATPGTVVQVGTHVTLTANVTNAGPSPEYQWYIGTSAISGATSSVFSYSMFADGDSVTCTVKGTGGCGLSGFNSVIMHVGGVGVQPGAAISDVRLIPNPNKGEFVVKGTLSVTADMEVDMEITNMLGQVVYRTKAIAHNGNIETRIRLDNTLANGMYMLNLRSANENKIFHFVLEQ